MTESAEPAGRRLPQWARITLVMVCSLVVIFALGVIAGIIAAGREDGFDTRTAALLAAFLTLGAVATWTGWALYAATPTGPVAPRVRTSRQMILFGAMLGVILGVTMAVSIDITQPGSLFGNGPIPALAAASTILLWTGGGLPITLIWLRSIDEHEMQANNSGALAALMTYVFVEPTWWLGWRGGFLPQQQPMLTFVLVLTVYAATWLWHRSR